jgi:hypothetical protein
MSLGQELAPHLPFLRRYARALTGTQGHGDAFVRATLEAIVASPDDFPATSIRGWAFTEPFTQSGPRQTSRKISMTPERMILKASRRRA